MMKIDKRNRFWHSPQVWWTYRHWCRRAVPFVSATERP